MASCWGQKMFASNTAPGPVSADHSQSRAQALSSGSPTSRWIRPSASPRGAETAHAATSRATSHPAASLVPRLVTARQRRGRPPVGQTMRMSARRLSVVMPSYNEESTIEAIVGRVMDSPVVAELVVVDDGSTDRTRDLLDKLAREDDRIRVLLQPANRGKGAALRRGFSAATADFVVVQDADLEYDPAEYSRLLEPLLDGRADVVYGSRFAGAQAHRVLYFWHSVGNRLLTLASNMSTDLNLTDMETCYKAFRREVVQSLDLREDRFGFEPEVTAKIAAGGWRVYEVGISYAGRTYAEGKKIGWRDGVRALTCIVRYSPLRARRGRRAGALR